VCSVCSVVPWLRGAQTDSLKQWFCGAYSGNLLPDRFRQQGDSLKGTLSLELQAEDLVEILAQGRIEPIVDRVFCRD
jgi:hypothetical protein